MLSFVFLLFIGLAASEFDYEIHRKFETLPKSDFVSYFNSLNFSWTIKEYKEDVHMHFGAIFDKNHGLPTVTHDVMKLPDYFDAREQWPHCETIKEINDQGTCGSCFLFGTINSISDRTCIHTGAHVHLSEQEGDCISHLKSSCDGGSSIDVLSFWVLNGLVTEECKPYNISLLLEKSCNVKCKNGNEYSRDKYFGEKIYTVDPNIDAIRTEIVKNGPVVVGIKLFADIGDYHGGVYEHKYGNFLSYHALRLIGYGTDESGIDYWLLANSWGPNHAEGGYLKIKQGQPELDLENNVFTGIPRNI